MLDTPAAANSQIVLLGKTIDEIRTILHQAQKNFPSIIKAAGEFAMHTASNKNVRFLTPIKGQGAFASELLSRAGGLANLESPHLKKYQQLRKYFSILTRKDLLLLAVKSWSEDKENIEKHLLDWRYLSRKVMLFGPGEGMPYDLKVDHVIDNGFSNISEDSQRYLSGLANVINAWIFIAEYCAQLTRLGFYPPVLSSVHLAGAKAYNQPLQTSKISKLPLQNVTSALEDGQLGTAYLSKVEDLLEKIASIKYLTAIEHIAILVAKRIGKGEEVVIASPTHILEEELEEEKKKGISLFKIYRMPKEFPELLQTKGLVVWFGYLGISNYYTNYSTLLGQSAADLITVYATPTPKQTNEELPNIIAHLEQHWCLPDAAISVPFPPGVIAPLSGIDTGLTYFLFKSLVQYHLQNDSLNNQI